jgi:opacity protein-like surface antigen
MSCAAAFACALASTVTVRADEAATTSTTAPALAPATKPNPDAWDFETTLPLWAPQVNGNATVRGRTADVNVNFSQLKDHLDNIFSLATEAHKGKLGFYGDVSYMKFSGGFFDALGGHTQAQLKFLIANGGVTYELIKTESEHPFILEGAAGVRYWYAATELSHRDATDTRDFSGGTTYNLVDPVLGLRASQYITSKLHLDIEGDGGGFDINHSTDWTWSAQAMLAYDFTKWFTLSAGYSALALDESTGSGTGEKGLNLIFSGIEADLTFKF